jgi:hypothetical protein
MDPGVNNGALAVEARRSGDFHEIQPEFPSNGGINSAKLYPKR